MILIVDSGSTKSDWIALDKDKNKVFKTRTAGLNPALLSAGELRKRITTNDELLKYAGQIKSLYFYGAGCGTLKPAQKLKNILQQIFEFAEITVAEDMLAAVYAASGGAEAIVCILGTGSNSCYYDGKQMYKNVDSLGYVLMDEASGNYFGKKLIVDYYYHRMPLHLALDFEKKFELAADEIKKNLYQKESPNAYLGQFAGFMFDHKNDKYIKDMLRNGFREFIQNRVLPYEKSQQIPVYFIGSIAYFFKDILMTIAKEYNLNIANIIRHPIDRLILFHQTKM